MLFLTGNQEHPSKRNKSSQGGGCCHKGNEEKAGACKKRTTIKEAAEGIHPAKGQQPHFPPRQRAGSREEDKLRHGSARGQEAEGALSWEAVCSVQQETASAAEGAERAAGRRG